MADKKILSTSLLASHLPPIVKSENAIESMDATETLSIEQSMGLAEQECPPSQQSNQNTVNSDCPQDSHLNKYDSILVELKKKEIERQAEIMDAIRGIRNRQDCPLSLQRGHCHPHFQYRAYGLRST